MVKLDKLNIEFDCYKETPYFQVNSKQRIRFGMEDLNITLIKKIIEDVFNEKENISVIFVSEYIVNNKRFSSKSKIGKIIDIKKWHENIVIDEVSGEGAVYVTIKNLERYDIIKYCSKIFKGHNEAYISFFTDESLVYVSSDVIDIISNNVNKITSLKENYSEKYNKYYDNNI
ncbi:hypothetical protein F3157_08860 [Virgibacillus dakarensis]|uniref:Uncharacterized protein n=1 Tax=Lentibacillus populi TaxID=1827502 RepID=A0A9W5TXM8_9BACI|nr:MULTISPECIES: hypothetical protein [Bacillaceae]MBT2217232.1 hypothetical protein [Virgibacillus dakarensis]MTW85766.1 hypothetical protein [Virgibacillus dakarensis]GGB43046.1 hypothetical protein GCM10011409_20800 [Lentibacillus populi]